jgi:uncharacterized membrane protein (DUF373 family)
MSIRDHFHFSDFRELKPIEKTIAIFSHVPIICYLMVALLLSILAFFSLINAANLILHVFGDMEDIVIGMYQAPGMYHAIHAILLTVIIIEMFETVTIYLRTKQIPILILLMVGLTAMIRHILSFGFDEVDTMDMVATAIVILVLVCGIYMLKNNPIAREIEDEIRTTKEGGKGTYGQGEQSENTIYAFSAAASSTSRSPSLIQNGTDIIIRYISYVPIFCYIITTLFLSIIAFISLFIAGEVVLLVSSGHGKDFALGIEHAIYAIFLTVIIIGLFETVQAYLTSRRIPIYTLLVVGATVTIRYVLLFTLGGISPTEIIAISAVMVALLAGIYLLHRNPPKNENKIGLTEKLT